MQTGAARPPDLDASGQPAGTRPPDLDAQGQPTFTSSNEKDASGAATVDPNTLGTFASHFGDQINPMNVVRAVAPLVPIPKQYGGGGVDAPGNLLKTAQATIFPTEILQKAHASFKQGDYVTAARHFIDYILPVIGPALEKPADEMQHGKFAAGMGDALGLGTALFGADGLSRMLKGVRTPALIKPNASVDFGRSRGVPIDAATATDNLAVKGTQALADRSLGGSMVATPALAAQSAAMERVGGELAIEAHPTPMTPETAGTSLRDALTAKQRGHEQTANTAYDKLRQIEADATPTKTQTGTKTVETGVLDADGRSVTRTTPIVESTKLAVDIRASKAQLKPIYNQLMREKDITPPMGAKGRALAALDRLMNAPDVAPVSIVDAALSDLKALDRATTGPGQGIVKQTVKSLDGAVQRAVHQAGPEAVRALQDGRQATIAKYQTADVLDTLHVEPVKAINSLTAPKDAAIQKLRTVTQQVPKQADIIARGYLEDLLAKPQMVAEWRKLGAQTRAILFPKAGQTAALDHFFTLTDRISKTNVNPSGSGYVASLTAQGMMLWLDPVHAVPMQISGWALSKLLRSPAAVQALTRGLTLPVKTPVAMRAAATAKLVQAAQDAGVALAPAAADQTSASGTP